MACEENSARPLLIAAVGRTLSASPLGRRASDLELRRVPVLPLASTLPRHRPVVVLLDRGLLAGAGDGCAAAEALESLAAVAAIVGVGDPGEADPPPEFPAELLTSYVTGDASPTLLLTQLRGAFRHAASLCAERRARADGAARGHELTELSRVGAALTTERNLVALLDLILTQARRVTASDAASLYLVDQDSAQRDGGPGTLRFRLAQNATLPDLPLREFTVPVDHTSLAGHAAATGEPLVVPDVYLLPGDARYRQNRSFDESFGYRTRSMLVIPMKTHKDEVVGVLQLINRKRDPDARLPDAEAVEREVIPYDARCVGLVTSLAAQAAVAIENTLLYESIERLFDGFVTAAVHAIEQRDPTTFGHSERVAAMSVGLAEAVTRAGAGTYRTVRFTAAELRELRYAGLLHDFGKVAVREKILVKQKKLYQGQLDLVRQRFAFLLQQADLDFERARADHLATLHAHALAPTHVRSECATYDVGLGAAPGAARRAAHGVRLGGDAVIAQLEAVRAARRAQLEHFLAAILEANEPTVLPSSAACAELARIGAERYRDHEGAEHPLLRGEELRFLMVPRGNLDDDERREIESHVTHTFAFLRQIPWTRELRRIPEIALAHHEKLDGSGYPRQVRGDEIPVQARMMTIADIFDALTATDRPYKPAVPVDRALDILAMEAREGMLDVELLATFREARVWDLLDHPVSGIPALPMASSIAVAARS